MPFIYIYTLFIYLVSMYGDVYNMNLHVFCYYIYTYTYIYKICILSDLFQGLQDHNTYHFSSPERRPWGTVLDLEMLGLEGEEETEGQIGSGKMQHLRSEQ